MTTRRLVLTTLSLALCAGAQANMTRFNLPSGPLTLSDLMSLNSLRPAQPAAASDDFSQLFQLTSQPTQMDYSLSYMDDAKPMTTELGVFSLQIAEPGGGGDAFVPVPGALLLGIFGLAALGARTRR